MPSTTQMPVLYKPEPSLPDAVWVQHSFAALQNSLDLELQGKLDTVLEVSKRAARISDYDRRTVLQCVKDAVNEWKGSFLYAKELPDMARSERESIYNTIRRRTVQTYLPAKFSEHFGTTKRQSWPNPAQELYVAILSELFATFHTTLL